MSEIILLRHEPELKFSLKKEGFELLDISEPKNNGNYYFSQIKNVELNKEKTNWIITLVSHIVELVAGTGGGDGYRKEANLKLEMNDRTVEIGLSGAYYNLAEVIVERIKP